MPMNPAKPTNTAGSWRRLEKWPTPKETNRKNPLDPPGDVHRARPLSEWKCQVKDPRIEEALWIAALNCAVREKTIPKFSQVHWLTMLLGSHPKNAWAHGRDLRARLRQALGP